jgi:uncharacterized UBP type Zn finger protein
MMKFVLRNRGATPKRVVSFRAGPPTGPFAGLRGDGGSRCLNSLVQSLYHTPIFRNAVLALGPVDKPDEENIILNLQILFWKLGHEKGPQSARDLTISMGWSENDGAAHQDAREFLRLLLDKLDGSTRSDISTIFGGKIRSTIVCEAAGHSQTRLEDFLDLQTIVRGCATLEESLTKAFAPISLVGSDQVEVDGRGTFDGMRIDALEELPDVLHLHLNRFEYRQRWATCGRSTASSNSARRST